ncbi:MAG: capsule assembly Wzi family protein [Armatimonadota bacterium]|nr:capsule assembly Wzi family protein [Armatimonadota bacterium]MDR7536145.1 capsule assembly Wzi family protein [Armatimonadota bacterium]
MAGALAAVCAQGAAAAPGPNAVVPADHWAYGALYRLAAFGVAPLWAASARPLPRLEVARMVAEALERVGATDGVSRAGALAAASDAVRTDLDALRAEFAAELRLLAAGRDARPDPMAVGAAATARVVSGAPPRFLRHDGGGVELSRLYLAGRVGDVAVQAGRDALWWGPGSRGAFLLSDNAGPLDALTLTLTSGRFRAVKMVAPLADGARYLYGLRVDWQARDDLRVGFGEVMVGTGGLEPLYALNVVPGVAYAIATRVRAPVRNDNYNFTVDLDWRPRPGVVAYGELYVDDLVLTADNPFPHRLGGTVGLYLADPFGDGRTGVRVEHSRATNWIYATPDAAAAYIRAGRALGHWCAPDCELWSVTVTRTFSPAAAVLVGYDLIRKGEGVLGQTWTDPDDARRRYYLSGVIETSHALRAGITRAWGEARAAATVVWTASTNAGHVAGATRQGWFVLVEASYGF